MKQPFKLATSMLVLIAVACAFGGGALEVGGAAAQPMGSRRPSMPRRPPSRMRGGMRAPSMPSIGNPDDQSGQANDPDNAPNVAPFEHLGIAGAIANLGSSDPEEQFAGLRRLEAAGTAESGLALVRVWEDRNSVLSDGRAWISLAYGLAKRASDPRAASVLIALCNQSGPARAPTPSAAAASTSSMGPSMPGAPVTPERPLVYDLTPAAALPFAREIAAYALARSQSPSAINALISMVREQTPGREAARLALLTEPPREWPELGPPNAALVDFLTALADLRAISFLRGAWISSDAVVRAAALRASAKLGDERAAPVARRALQDEQLPVLRAAAGEVLVRLGTPDAEAELLKLLEDPRTSREVLPLVRLRPAPAHTKMLVELLTAATNPEDARALAATLAAIGTPASATALGAAIETGPYPTIVLQALALGRQSNLPNTDLATRSQDAHERELLRLFALPKTHLLAAAGVALRALQPGLGLGPAATARIQPCAELASDSARGICSTLALEQEPRSFERTLRSSDVRVQRAAAQWFANAGPEGRTPQVVETAKQILGKGPASEVAFALRAGLMQRAAAPDRAPASVTQASLAACAKAGGLDAAYCTHPLARHPQTDASLLQELTASPDSRTLIQVLRGLGEREDDAWLGLSVRLAQWEPRAEVRKLARLALRTRQLGSAATAELNRHAELDLQLATNRAAAPTASVGFLARGALLLAQGGALQDRKTEQKAAVEAYAAVAEDATGQLWVLLFDDSGIAIAPRLQANELRGEPQIASFTRSAR